jgi:hypothetical protein
VFADVTHAVEFCLAAQLAVLALPYPVNVLQLPDCGVEVAESAGEMHALCVCVCVCVCVCDHFLRVASTSVDGTTSPPPEKKKKSRKAPTLFRGPRLRSAVHIGVPVRALSRDRV